MCFWYEAKMSAAAPSRIASSFSFIIAAIFLSAAPALESGPLGPSRDAVMERWFDADIPIPFTPDLVSLSLLKS